MKAGTAIAIIGFLIIIFFALPISSSSPPVGVFVGVIGFLMMIGGLASASSSKEEQKPLPPPPPTPSRARDVAYEHLRTKVKKLEEELKAKDEIINALKEELKKSQVHEHPTSIEGEESFQSIKKTPRIRLIAYDTDLAVYDYIIAHQGTINLRKAARDLGLSIEQLKEAIERLKKEGRLTET
ncbi:MAG: hypothetical protein QXK93_08455 [Candidatus Bathyarchaeia archaeon]